MSVTMEWQTVATMHRVRILQEATTALATMVMKETAKNAKVLSPPLSHIYFALFCAHFIIIIFRY